MGLPIYDNIDRLLEENGMSRRQLALKAGIGEGTMSTAFARRSTMFHPTNLQKIADTLGVTVDELKSEPLNTTPTGRPGEAAVNPGKSHPFHVWTEDEIKQEISADLDKLNLKGKKAAMQHIKILIDEPLFTEKEKSPDTEASEDNK